MQYITRFITDCLAATGEEVCLLIGNVGAGTNEVFAAIVNADDGSTITLKNDWSIKVECQANSVQQALEALEEICAEDYMGA